MWVVLLLVIVAVFLLFRYVGSMGKGAKATQAKQTASAPAGQAPGQQGETRRPLTPAEYIAAREPRVGGIPESAQIYDELAKPSDFPHMSACILSKKSGRCTCYTQQDTEIYGIDSSACAVYAKKGWFNSYLTRDRQ